MQTKRIDINLARKEDCHPVQLDSGHTRTQAHRLDFREFFYQSISFHHTIMKHKNEQIAEWFLRTSLSAGFLSAVADRFGFWGKAHSAWGDWHTFIQYTQTLNPWFSEPVVQFLGGLSTLLEILFAFGLITRFKTIFTATGSGILLLLFALAMTFSKSVKAPLDYSVFTASAAAFYLAVLYNNQRKHEVINDETTFTRGEYLKHTA
jgi:thiosulfate dehydrogenase (quinone) large subunit